MRDGMRERRRREWLIPFARSLTRQTARKAPPHKGCSKIGRSPRCAPWHRSPGYDLRRAPYDHPDFTSNALSKDLFSASLSLAVIFNCFGKSSVVHYGIRLMTSIRDKNSSRPRQYNDLQSGSLRRLWIPARHWCSGRNDGYFLCSEFMTYHTWQLVGLKGNRL